MNWHDHLMPWATKLDAIRLEVEALDTDTLTGMSDAFEKPTQTNCWFGVYAFAEVARPWVKSELYRRERLAAE